MSLSYQLAKLLLLGQVTVEELINVLTKYKMLALLPSVKKALSNLSLGEGMRSTIMIETPFPLSDQALEKVKTIAGERSAPHIVTINKNVLAGFKARFKGTLYDGSAERIIKQLINH